VPKLGECPEQWQRFVERYLLDMALNVRGIQTDFATQAAAGAWELNATFRGMHFIACPFCGVKFELGANGAPLVWSIIGRHL
jgi:hypothetical protein